MSDKLFNYRVDATKMVTEELESLKQRIIANMRANNQVASGRTIASMVVEGNSGENGIALYGHKPFGVLETGRRGGKVPTGFRWIILQWMQDKGIHSDKGESGDRSMAYLIARKIADEGTELFRNQGRDDVYSNEIPTTIENISDKLCSLMGECVDECIPLNQKETIVGD